MQATVKFMSNKDKINFDLDFLDKNVKEKPKKDSSSKDPNWVFHDGKSNQEKKYTKKESPAKVWMWGIGVVGVIVLIGIFSGDNSNNTSNSTNGSVQIGQYMCSSYAATQADNMAPNTLIKSQLESESSRIDAETQRRSLEENYLNNAYVDTTDQYAVDSYNTRLEAFKNGYQAYSDRYDAYEQREASYNQTVDAYNNYLINNCTYR